MDQHRLLLRIGILVAVCTLFLLAVVPSIEQAGNGIILNSFYALRGERALDSAISVLYFSRDDIAALGGLPLKRNYYALLINTLKELECKTIGIDIAFSEPDVDRSEYDNVLACAVENAANVVLATYCTDIGRSPEDTETSPGGQRALLKGKDLQLPFEKLRLSAAGMGHTNFVGDNRIPLFLRTDTGLIPTFAFEIYRQWKGIPSQSIAIENNLVTMVTPSGIDRIRTGEGVTVTVNYTGGLASLRAHSVVRFLQAYDSLHGGRRPSFDVKSVRGRIVLIGIIAEGRSTLVPSPFAEQLPSLALHAMALDNLIRDTLLSDTSLLIRYLNLLIAGALTILIMRSRHFHTGLAGTALLFIAVLVVGYMAFDRLAVIIPTWGALIMIITTGSAMMIWRSMQTGREVRRLTHERDQISKSLSEKERTLASLEQQLTEASTDATNNRIATLLRQIDQYRHEISTLRSQAEDLDTAMTQAPPASSEAREFHSLIYAPDSPMVGVIEMVRKVATSDATVLLSGESGTGKELVARALHGASKRNSHPFVAVNCGALPETLLESELFGHERGAFTGAVKDRKGRFEIANGGTMLLDEITETSDAFQVKLLRVLQEGSFERVGGTIPVRVDVRVVAATNRDIREEVERKRFREDLYYRINVITIDIPPLRKRPQDIPHIVRAYLGKEGSGWEVSAAALKALEQGEWKGNVRELQSALTRALLMARSEGRTLLRMKDLPEDIQSAFSLPDNLEEQIMSGVRARKFGRSAMTETAEELGGLNRGTVAEYVRGVCFRTFVEHEFQYETAVSALCGSSDPDVTGKAEKKFLEYLANAVESVDPNVSIDQVMEKSRPKYKNLPLRYHPFLDAVLTSYYKGIWRLRK